ncbi:MAG: fimbrillin family protein [Bacteroides sp.]|nr:fimbrillin family protein [Bacteroides sp.]
MAGGSTIYFPLSGAGVDFHAWHPYHAVSEKWVIDLAGQSSQSALDLLTADAVSTTAGTIYSKDHPAVRFEFVHRLFKLALSIKPGTGLSTTALAGLQVDITRQWTSADYDPRLDALSVEHASSAISLLTAADGRQAEAILFPDDWAGGDPETGRQLVFTLATGEKLYYDIPDAKRFLAGERNLYTITVNRTDLSVTSQITGWAAGNGEEGETGSAE